MENSEAIDYDMCHICNENERAPRSSAYTCTNQACKITHRLFVWKIKVYQNQTPPKNSSRGGGGGVDFTQGKPMSYTYYWYNIPREEVINKLQQVRAKIALLSKLKSIESIQKALNDKFCNLKKYQITKMNYEEHRSIFNTR